MINLSIIIPHYNSTASLERLLETIPDLKEIQIIVVDDHSDVKFKEELVKLEEKNSHRNIEFFSNEPGKKSAGACRNIGLNNSNGNWLLFADADDYFVEGFFGILQEYFNSENDVIFFKPTSIKLDTGEISDRHLPFVDLIDKWLNEKNSGTEALLRYSFSIPVSKLIKLKLVKENEIYFDEVVAANDVMFSTKVGYYMDKFEVSENVIYCVTRGKGTLTTTISHDVFDARIDVFIIYYHFLKERLITENFNVLDLSGRGFLIKSMKLGIRKVFSVYLKLKRNGIQAIGPKILNPIWFVKRALFAYSKNKAEKKYYKRIESKK